MNDENPATVTRLQTMLENIRTATANTRRAMESLGDENWVEDGESDAEYFQAIQRDTIARLDATARDIESLLAGPLNGQAGG
ncbi:hypothetical protein PY310_16850 [Pseudarthrobacter sp. H3Y2-7]|jgi:hypothetical protein|uniref:hypothetical protein n=1 Tax=Pseudarthrobacter TaxID=1742993 RepID=UPI0023AFEF08|nr:MULTISPECIES: hypothetical protein [unclassified Pseudarthrobacter]MDE8670249.1 hypothetical protein [Pseudarthrobacter sp. H3Y2-7]